MRCLHVFGRHGKLAQSSPGCMGESIGKRCGRRRKGTFAGTVRRIAALHQNGFNSGNLRKREYRIARPVPARDLPFVEGDLLLQSETDRLDDASFKLIFRPVRIDDKTNIGSQHNPGDFDDTCLSVDLHVHHRGGIRPDALVPTIRYAAPMPPIALPSWSPARLVRSSLKHGLGSWIPKMQEPERQRVHTRDVGELVHKGFDCENVSMSSQRSERSISYGRVEEEMVSDLLSRQLVGRHRIAVSVAERLRDMRSGRFDEGGAQIPRSEKIHAAGLTRPHRVTVAPKIV